MTFNSFAFLLFFSLVLGLFYLLKPVYRKYLLLLASYAFYMSWKAIYVVLLLFTTSIDYVSGIQIQKSTSISKKRFWVLLSIGANLGMLASFRYASYVFPLLANSFNLFGFSGSWNFTHVIIPIGISFYTFQSISYVLDVYYGRVKAERDFVSFAVFVSFFPQLLSGPIDKSYHLLPQFKNGLLFDSGKFNWGIKLIIWGLFKKMVVADNLAPFVNKVFLPDYPAASWEYLFAVIVFTIQIYADFSGYSDIAIGTSSMFGVRLKDNFMQPYFASNIQTYWKKWHISLTDWFRDYVFNFIAIELRDFGRVAVVTAIIVTFILSGLWHGEALTFVIWGLLHGIYLSVFFLLGKKVKLKTIWPGLLLTWIVVLFANIFFRAASVNQAADIISSFAALHIIDLSQFNWAALPKIGLLFSVIMFVIDFKLKDLITENYFSNGNAWTSYFQLSLLLVAILVFGQFSSSEFIYFKF